MSAAIDRLFAMARAEGDAGTTERDEKGSALYTMTRPMSDAVNAAGRGDDALLYLQSGDGPPTEGFFDEEDKSLIEFPMRATMTHIGRDIVGDAPVRKPPLWPGLLVGIAGVLQMLFALVDLSILRAVVGLGLFFGGASLLYQRHAAIKLAGKK